MDAFNIRNVCVVGLGTVGLPVAVHASQYFEVSGYDLNPKAVGRAKAKGISASESWPFILKPDVYVVAVSTGLDKEEKTDVSAIHDVCEKIAQTKRDSLVCIESTVPVGTSRRMAEEFELEYIVHCPHRYWVKDPVRYGVVQNRVLGGLNEESIVRAKLFYEALKVPIYHVASLEIAEISKIAENSYRFVQIAFAEELKLICERSKLSFDEVRMACNTKWNIDILEAREGIEGQCLPKDIRYLADPEETPLLTAAIEADGRYKAYRRREPEISEAKSI